MDANVDFKEMLLLLNVQTNLNVKSLEEEVKLLSESLAYLEDARKEAETEITSKSESIEVEDIITEQEYLGKKKNQVKSRRPELRALKLGRIDVEK